MGRLPRFLRRRVALTKPPRKVRRGQVLTPVCPNDLEVFLLGLCAWSGFLGLAGSLGLGTRTPSHIPTWLEVGWYCLLLVGGLSALGGVYWPDPLVGMLVLRAALWPVAAGAAMYCLSAARYGQPVGAVIVTGAFAVCLASRARRLGHQPIHILEGKP